MVTDDLERFRRMAENPTTTIEQLKQMRINAQRKNETECVELAERVLKNRFPGWNQARKRNSGATPTRARFRGQEKWFSTAKEGYVWLINNFIHARPDVLDSADWKRDFVAKGRSVNYFSRDLKSLFIEAPHLAADPNMYTRLGDGWFAVLNLSNEQKFHILSKFAAVAKFEFGRDWDWLIEGVERPSINF